MKYQGSFLLLLLTYLLVACLTFHGFSLWMGIFSGEYEQIRKARMAVVVKKKLCKWREWLPNFIWKVEAGMNKHSEWSCHEELAGTHIWICLCRGLKVKVVLILPPPPLKCNWIQTISLYTAGKFWVNITKKACLVLLLAKMVVTD